MANQIQQQVLVNGEWRSQSVDVYQLMARAQQQADVEMAEPEPRPQRELPRYGLLSRTVLPSPYVKFIIPANIRQKSYNDVVFVGEDSIHLREIRAKGHLCHVASKTDFKGRILAARVFGEPRRFEINAAHGVPIQRMDVHAARKPYLDGEPDVLPPEVLVLTLSSRTLMFLWTDQTDADTVRFRHKTVLLGPDDSRYNRPGTFLAVDPRCRAIAVATPEGHFTLYKTKTLETWREAVRAGQDALPIDDERRFEVPGRIMHMEFLSSNAVQDEYHVVLLFVLVHDQRTKFTCYDWDTRCDLSTVTARAERVSVDIEDTNASLLIPARRSTDFLLVCDRHIASYMRILSGTPQRKKTSIHPTLLVPLRPGDNSSPPIWVQWERVVRNDTFPPETFYLAREDGLVLYAELSTAGTVDISHAGEWPYPLDRAFASLDADVGTLKPMTADVLIAAGTTNDGLLQRIGPWIREARNAEFDNNLNPVESLPNWSPVTDLAVTRLPGAEPPSKRESDSIFVANGRAPHGNIAEMRLGLKAMMGSYSIGMGGCTGLWIIGHGGGKVEGARRDVYRHYVDLVTSLPPESLAIRVSLEDGEMEMEDISGLSDSVQDGIMRDEETIAAGLLSERFSVQVTPKEARILSRKDFTPIASLTAATFAQLGVQPTSDFMLAAVLTRSDAFVAVAFREASGSSIQVMPIMGDGSFGKPISQKLDHDPTCLELLDIAGQTFVCASTMDSSLFVFSILDGLTMQLAYRHELRPGSGIAPTEMPAACEGVALLVSGETKVLLCGMRDGILLSLSIEISSPSEIRLISSRIIRMGLTVVRITRSATDPSIAFVACGADLCRVQALPSRSPTVSIDSIWITDSKDDGYQQSAVTALAQVPLCQGSETSDNELEAFLFAVSGDRLLSAQLDYDNMPSDYRRPQLPPERSKPVPRKLATGGTPLRFKYSEQLSMLVVASTETKEEQRPPNGYRAVYSTLQLVKPVSIDANIKQEGDTELHEEHVVVAEYPLHHYETVNCMIDWVIKDNKGRPHHFIYVGTGVKQRPDVEIGRRLFFQVVDQKFKLKKEKEYSSPVYCMALLDDSGQHLITALGKKLIVEEYQMGNARWAKRGEIQLTSPAVHISTHDSFVYVSTRNDSHVCFDGTLEAGSSPVFSDERQRQLAHHLVYPLNIDGSASRGASTIVLLSDKTCNIVGLLHPSESAITSSAPTLFEARLPRSVTRLVRGDVRPPWRRPCDQKTLAAKSIPGVLADDIVGTCSDGTLYTFSILGEAALRLLRFMQNLAKIKEDRKPENKHSVVRYPGGRPRIVDLLFNGAAGDQDTVIKARDVDPDARRRVPAEQHVDGDLISKFLDASAGRAGRTEGRSLHSLITIDVEDSVGVLFHQLAKDAGIEGAEGDASEALRGVEDWLHDVLLPIL